LHATVWPEYGVGYYSSSRGTTFFVTSTTI